MNRITPLFRKLHRDDVVCFATTREGGCSKGNYASFNCNHYCGDDMEHVKRNRELLCSDLQIEPERLIVPHQTHHTEIRLIDASFFALSEQEKTDYLEGVDATISALPAVCLCISTADCIPVLLYDPKHKAIAAIHAGWRGTVKCIVSKTIQKMTETFGTDPEDLLAAIGPGISFESFEVGQEVYDEFDAAGFPMPFIARQLPSMQEEEAQEGVMKWHIDLWQANRLQLMACGVKSEQIEIEGTCTFLHDDVYFSARKLGIKSGRILSGIMINNK